MNHYRDWYIVPGDLHASLRELLHWHQWREAEIECFLKIFAEYEMRETPLLSDFQNSLIHEKSLSRLGEKNSNHGNYWIYFYRTGARIESYSHSKSIYHRRQSNDSQGYEKNPRIGIF